MKNPQFYFVQRLFSHPPCHAFVSELFNHLSANESTRKWIARNYISSRPCCGTPLQTVEFVLAHFTLSNEDLFQLACNAEHEDSAAVFEHVISRTPLGTDARLLSFLFDICFQDKPRLFDILRRHCKEIYAVWCLNNPNRIKEELVLT